MKRINKSSAVMQQRSARVKEGDDPETALYRKLGHFCTPPWAARAGAEILLELDDQARTIWEPACGRGHIAEPLKEYFPVVHATDIHDYGYGGVQDFLLDPPRPGQVDWCFSNPPYHLAAEFLRKGLAVADRGVALLLRIAFLEGVERHGLLYLGDNPLTLCCPFSERVAMVLGGWDPDAQSASCYAWFYFSKIKRWGLPRIQPVGPGTKARLTRRDDARRFATEALAQDGGLFKSVG